MVSLASVIVFKQLVLDFEVTREGGVSASFFGK
jgi:hypothetical protein